MAKHGIDSQKRNPESKPGPGDKPPTARSGGQTDSPTGHKPGGGKNAEKK